tara:strand:- start:58 stop:543 length:486 start_codon:yes stop_codon:yes gene_type:complete
MRNNIVPKSCKEIRFSWIHNYNSKKYLLNRNKRSLIKFFLKGKITKKQHKIFLKKYSYLERLDFILVKKNTQKMVGAINLKKKKSYFEIGKFISDQKYISKGIMQKAFFNFLKYVRNYFKIKEIYSETKITNYRNIIFNLKNNFKIQETKKNLVIMKLKLN